MEILNIAIKFNNFEMFEHFVKFWTCRLLPPAA